MEAACELVWEGPSAISGSRWRVFCWTDRAISGTCACACVVRFRGEAMGRVFLFGDLVAVCFRTNVGTCHRDIAVSLVCAGSGAGIVGRGWGKLAACSGV